MADNEILRMRPAEIAEASARLDALAGRVEQLMHTESAHLSVQAGARDEVSQRVFTTLAGVHETFGASAERGVTEMRETAATLRAQAGDVSHLDDGFAI